MRLARQVLGGDGWEGRLAALMIVDSATVWRWKVGRSPIPGAVLVALRCMARERQRLAAEAKRSPLKRP
ncbi:hypothetical protein [Reyranella sp. CPCC 100927]|uniref:hypothetical protein n=1 Tax=Reyranella sp. CPCC 100927 TaxID=2599616 RepID=UPI0011B58A84|nr:hypothetical protein [Reyranella sp. CPCC 100927]TWT15728.1 hypothetical protein FQU96_05135 [Reyranella sp. CPCC 100927]